MVCIREKLVNAPLVWSVTNGLYQGKATNPPTCMVSVTNCLYQGKLLNAPLVWSLSLIVCIRKKLLNAPLVWSSSLMVWYQGKATKRLTGLLSVPNCAYQEKNYLTPHWYGLRHLWSGIREKLLNALMLWFPLLKVCIREKLSNALLVWSLSSMVCIREKLVNVSLRVYSSVPNGLYQESYSTLFCLFLPVRELPIA